MAQAKVANTAERPQARAQVTHTLGFGVPATSDPHHFKVIISKASSGKVQISEHLGLQAANADGARAAGLQGHHFRDAATLRAALVANGLLAT